MALTKVPYKYYFLQYLEAIIWGAALVAFALSPLGTDPHFSLCPLKAVGFEHCIGCGLGRSLILLLHGEISQSISMHIMGIPALAILVWRIWTVIVTARKYRKMISNLL